MIRKRSYEKVITYITLKDRLLVFRHTEFPEAGIQVPAGTIEAGEIPAIAAMREAEEETGLTDLSMNTFLGSDVLQVEINSKIVDIHRHFYHLSASENAPERWIHYENDPSDGSHAPIEFEFYWVSLKGDLPYLSGDQGAFLNLLG